MFKKGINAYSSKETVTVPKNKNKTKNHEFSMKDRILLTMKTVAHPQGAVHYSLHTKRKQKKPNTYIYLFLRGLPTYIIHSKYTESVSKLLLAIDSIELSQFDVVLRKEVAPISKVGVPSVRSTKNQDVSY